MMKNLAQKSRIWLASVNKSVDVVNRLPDIRRDYDSSFDNYNTLQEMKTDKTVNHNNSSVDNSLYSERHEGSYVLKGKIIKIIKNSPK